ncbi:Uncharacterised protein [Enterobacter cloacae]|nr:Uncharacterised protein [Enterobacter cloacae]
MKLMTIPSPPMKKKTCDQPTSCVSQPMIGAKITVAKYCAELKMATAVPLSCAGNQAATIRLLPGNDGASAKPTRKRRVKSAMIMPKPLKISTKPCNRVNIDQMKMDQK